MRIQFEGNQPHQLRAIASVAELLQGQPRRLVDFAQVDLGPMFGSVTNRLDLSEEELLHNLHLVQKDNGISLDSGLQWIEDTIRTVAGDQQVRFANFSVEMETGTGKTYVYLRTALELNRRYGLRKFIVVVPSVAVREGVIKTLKITQEHLRALYDNVPYRFTVYDSKSIARVRQFAQSDCVELLVMTIDSFNKEDNVIRQSTDRLQGATPLFLVQSSRPVLILDEPQNMESEGRIRALASLDPLFALRYSATHRNPYNLAYRLTPFEAYRQSLVKKIQVASVVKEDDFNQVFVRIEEIRSAAKTVQAKIALHKRMAGATIKEKAFLFKPGDCLADKANRPEYASFVIDEINAGDQLVKFKNGIEIAVGQTQGADQAALFREQIRYTVEEHLRKQSRLKAAGIKVLSLFFIDRVENFVDDPPADKTGLDVSGLYPGIIRELFDEAFEKLKLKFPDFADKKASDVRGSYFAKKKRRGGEEDAIDSTSGQSAEDRAAYNLIMKDKERLLSLDEPVAFIFPLAKSTLLPDFERLAEPVESAAVVEPGASSSFHQWISPAVVPTAAAPPIASQLVPSQYCMACLSPLYLMSPSLPAGLEQPPPLAPGTLPARLPRRSVAILRDVVGAGVVHQVARIADRPGAGRGGGVVEGQHVRCAEDAVVYANIVDGAVEQLGIVGHLAANGFIIVILTIRCQPRELRHGHGHSIYV